MWNSVSRPKGRVFETRVLSTAFGLMKKDVLWTLGQATEEATQMVHFDQSTACLRGARETLVCVRPTRIRAGHSPFFVWLSQNTVSTKLQFEAQIFAVMCTKCFQNLSGKLCILKPESRLRLLSTTEVAILLRTTAVVACGSIPQLTTAYPYNKCIFSVRSDRSSITRC